MKQLKLGIPKGSLEKATIDLFYKAGWRILTSSRSYFPSIDDDTINCAMVRAQEMSRYVESGVFDLGLTGKDWILENDSQIVVVEDLIYSKVSNKPVRWVLVVRENSSINSLEDLAGKKIATELVNFTKRYFEKKKIKVEVEFSWGATEAKVMEGLADAIVEVTETGSTLRANNLRIVEELLVTNTQLIANKEAWDDPWKKEKISQISLLLKGALKAESLVGMKMNVAQKNLENVVNTLPSLNFPTVSHLSKKDWFSVESVVSVEEVRELIPQLQKNGAEGIIEYPLNKAI